MYKALILFSSECPGAVYIARWSDLYSVEAPTLYNESGYSHTFIILMMLMHVYSRVGPLSSSWIQLQWSFLFILSYLNYLIQLEVFLSFTGLIQCNWNASLLWFFLLILLSRMWTETRPLRLGYSLVFTLNSWEEWQLHRWRCKWTVTKFSTDCNNNGLWPARHWTMGLWELWQWVR